MTDLTDTPACPICGGGRSHLFAEARDIEYRTSDVTFQYVKCPTCETVFLPNPPVDRLDEIYPVNYYSYATAGSGGSLELVKQWLDARMFTRILRQLPGEKLAVLDVGGGWGWLLSAVRKLSPRVAATHEIDIDEHARARAEQEGHVFHCVRVEEFQPPRPFDLILLLNLIEHVSQPGEVLSAMAKALTPNGRILIKTPNVDTLDCRLFRKRNWGGFHCPRHFVLFTKGSLSTLAERHGLKVVRAAYTQGGPQWAVSFLGVLSDWNLIRVTPDRPMYRHPLYTPALALGAAMDFARRPFAPTAQMFFELTLDDQSEA